MELAKKHCKPCEGGVCPMPLRDVQAELAKVPGWTLEEGAIVKTFQFQNYYQTMAFVNATAWISHQEDHHPELVVGYKDCKVKYITHAINGLSENDFICAAKVDSIL